MIIYAIDYWGTLSAQPAIVGLANDLLKAGHEVHVVSHVFSAQQEVNTRRLIYKLGIPFTSIHVGDYSVGKGEVLKSVKADVLIDNCRNFCRLAVESGVDAIATPRFDEISDP